VADQVSLGIVLCDSAECEWRAGESAAARAALDEARRAFESAAVGAQSELGQAVARVTALLAASPAGPATR
jgi:hypothetical protein